MWNRKQRDRHKGTPAPEMARVERELEAARADAEQRRDVVRAVTSRAHAAAIAMRAQVEPDTFGDIIDAALKGERGRA